jgi:4-hydroxy-tetrahydrodipicolinate reductase
MLKVIVTGAAGRMGRAILDRLAQAEGITLGAALEQSGHPAIGSFPFPHSPSSIIDSIKTALESGEVVIDFTEPACTMPLLAEAGRKPMVIGTTGFTEAQRAEIARAAKIAPIVLSPNMSIGVNVMLKLLTEATMALGAEYDVEIVEVHHRHKKDAPSGTALRMGEVIAEARGTSLDQSGCFSRHGMIGPRPSGEIGIQTVRAGDVVGDHTVIFAGQGERIELTHRAHNRNHFAIGALRAAQWVVDQPPGLYTMRDVLKA